MKAINPCLSKYHFPLVPRSIFLHHILICGCGSIYRLTWYLQELYTLAEEYFTILRISKISCFVFYTDNFAHIRGKVTKIIVFKNFMISLIYISIKMYSNFDEISEIICLVSKLLQNLLLQSY